MATTDNLIISFEVEVDGETKRISISDLTLLPNVGHEVTCDYVHGEKVRFEVQKVMHHLSSIGHDILQQVTVYGRSI
jgi:hypothetical protein